ncbi:hypothetical protein E2C01_089228 [Portunus trituberculatus]|uniref:Uncharacterized protein n=1 Tax=Portunus trituberculatus TaxID=210409 RepID=A0A5B7JII9_PORTR|nr:hypothetical protein [Portunus trituberculatus]
MRHNPAPILPHPRPSTTHAEPHPGLPSNIQSREGETTAAITYIRPGTRASPKEAASSHWSTEGQARSILAESQPIRTRDEINIVTSLASRGTRVEQPVKKYARERYCYEAPVSFPQ